jgi:hypothetical protein
MSTRKKFAISAIGVLAALLLIRPASKPAYLAGYQPTEQGIGYAVYEMEDGDGSVGVALGKEFDDIEKWRSAGNITTANNDCLNYMSNGPLYITWSWPEEIAGKLRVNVRYRNVIESVFDVDLF